MAHPGMRVLVVEAAGQKHLAVTGLYQPTSVSSDLMATRCLNSSFCGDLVLGDGSAGDSALWLQR